MQALRYKRILKTLRWAINLALFVELAIAIIGIVLMVVVINSDEKLVSGWSAFLPETTESYDVSQSHQLETAVASAKEISIQFSATGMGYYFLKFIETIFTLSIIIGITFLLGKVFRSLYREHPFTTKNVKRLKYIATLLMVFTPYGIIQSLVYRNYISNHIAIEEKTYVHSLFPTALKQDEIWLDFQWDLEYLLLGGLLLIIVEIFRVGIELKMDNESIL